LTTLGRAALKCPALLAAVLCLASSLSACGSRPETQARVYTLPTVPTITGCAPDKQNPIAVIPGKPLLAVSAIVRPNRVRDLKSLLFALTVDDGKCVFWSQQQGRTISFGFPDGTNPRIFGQVAAILESTGDFSSVTVTR
jgi:hypothetical protein